MTFFFDVCLDVFMQPAAVPVTVSGLSVFSKKVILYGSEGNVKIFSSDFKLDEFDHQNMFVRNLPKATVQVAEPIALSAKLGCVRSCCELPGYIPSSVAAAIGGTIDTSLCADGRTVFATLGLFTIIQLIRNVQMLVPVYDFCIPEKQCDDATDTPCDVFRKIKFPTDDFFPPRPCDIDSECGCGCGCAGDNTL